MSRDPQLNAPIFEVFCAIVILMVYGSLVRSCLTKP